MAQPSLRRWIRLGVSAAAFAVLLAIVPLASIVAAIGRVPLRTLLAALALFLAGHVAAALKWRMLQGREAAVPMRTLLRAHFAGVIANLWLPSVVGGDVVRAGLALRQSSRPGRVAVASLVDRGIDSIGLVLLAGAGFYVVGVAPEGTGEVLVAMAVLALAGGAAAAGAYSVVKRRARNPRLLQILDACGFLAERPLLMVLSLAISVGVQATFVGVNLTLGRAVGVGAPIAAWFMAWPLAKLAALLPISAAGFGVREAALVVLLRPFGDGADALLAAGLLWQAVFIAGGALGWILLSLIPQTGVAASGAGADVTEAMKAGRLR